jgi:hypothetical protein
MTLLRRAGVGPATGARALGRDASGPAPPTQAGTPDTSRHLDAGPGTPTQGPAPPTRAGTPTMGRHPDAGSGTPAPRRTGAPALRRWVHGAPLAVILALPEATRRQGRVRLCPRIHHIDVLGITIRSGRRAHPGDVRRQAEGGHRARATGRNPVLPLESPHPAQGRRQPTTRNPTFGSSSKLATRTARIVISNTSYRCIRDHNTKRLASAPGIGQARWAPRTT